MLNWFQQVPAPEDIWDPSYSTAFKIGSLEIKWYAIFIMCGFLLAIFLSCMKMWKRYKVQIEPFYWFILIGVPTSILGSRLGSCIIGDADWADFFNFRTGGLAIEWGVTLTVIVGFIYFPLVLKKPKFKVRDEFGETPQVRRASVWLYADAVMPAILIAQFLGRWGNYFNQELYGDVVNNEGLQKFLHDCLPWMWVGTRESGAYHQPLFLWEGLINIVGFLFLYFGVEFIKKRKTGDMAAGYLLWYGIVRLCLEPLRDSSFTFPLTYAMSATFVLAGLIFIILNHTVIAKKRDIKVWHTFIYKNVEKINKSRMPKKIRKLELKYNTLKSASEPDQEAIKEAQQKLESYKESWGMLQFKYASNEYKNSFTRTEAEKVYFARW